jgi:hypothetical protein
MNNRLLCSITSSLLALFAGGSITILFILIPFWKTLAPAGVDDWFRNFGSSIGLTMMSLELLPFLFSILTFARVKGEGERQRALWLGVNILNLLVLLLFFVYFLPVNLSFIKDTIAPEAMPKELVRWQVIHAFRTLLAVLSAAFSIAACIQPETQMENQ